MTWEPSSFLISSVTNGIVEKTGYVYRGLGLHQRLRPSPKGRRPAIWNLTHLNTGHKIVELKGSPSTVFPVAAEIAECSDWGFSGLQGWRNCDPGLISKVRAIVNKNPTVLTFGDHVPGDDAIASKIAMERA